MLTIEKTHVGCPQEEHDSCGCLLTDIEVVVKLDLVPSFALDAIEVEFEVQS